MSNFNRMRQFVSLAVVSGGAVLLIYGLLFHSALISSAEDTKVTSSQAETALIREVTVGGLARDESGQIKKTYSGKAPEACPT